MGAPYLNSLPQYWHIDGSLDEFRRDCGVMIDLS